MINWKNAKSTANDAMTYARKNFALQRMRENLTGIERQVFRSLAIHYLYGHEFTPTDQRRILVEIDTQIANGRAGRLD